MRVQRACILILLLAGCSQAPADLDIPQIQVGDYWIYEASHDGEVFAVSGALVAKEGMVGDQPAFMIQHFVQGMEGSPKASTQWATADEARVARAQAFDLTGRLNSAFTYVAYEDPCPGRPPMEPFPPTEVSCAGWSHFVDDEGRVFGMRPFVEHRRIEWLEAVTIAVPGGDVDAALVEYRSTARIDGVAREVVAQTWFSPKTCGAARSEAEGMVTSLVGFRCGGRTAGLSLAEAGLTAVPLMDADEATLRPSQVTAECTMRPVYVQAAGTRQEVFGSSCDIADQRTFDRGAIVGRLQAVATWEGEESVIVEGTLTIGDQSVSGTSPLELELADVDGTFEGMAVRLDFEGVAFAPQTEIDFTFSDLHG